MKLRDMATLLLLASIWGASFLFIKIGAHAFGAWVLVALRVLIASAVLFGVAQLLRQPTTLRAHWKPFLALGLVNSAIPFTLIATAELQLPASFAAILNATTPLFTSIIAFFWLKDPLTPKKLFGLAFGLVGVVMVVGWSPFELTPPVLTAILMMFGASFSYGVGTVYSKQGFSGVNTMTMAIGQQLGAGAIITPFALASLPTEPPTLGDVGAVLALAILCTAFAYILYFTLVRRVGATNTSTVTMLVPFFGILWGAIFLNESIEWGQVVGFLVILFSLTLVTGLRLSPLSQLRLKALKS